MPIRGLHFERSEQPPYFVGIDYSHPIARDLAFAWTPVAPTVLASARQLSGAMSGATIAANTQGTAMTVAASASAGVDFGTAQPLGEPPITILAYGAPINTGVRRTFFSQRTTTGNIAQYSFIANANGAISPSAGGIVLYCRDASAGVATVSDAAGGQDGAPHVWIVGRGTGTEGFIDCDGIDLGATVSALTAGTFSVAAQSVRVGNFAAYTGTDVVHTEPLYLVLAWNRLLTPSERAALGLNPWLLFEPELLLMPRSAATNSRTITPSGGIVFSGAVALIRGRVFPSSGGVVFGGTAALETHSASRTIPVSGGVVFGGAAPMTFASGNSRTIIPSGGVTFGGAAALIKGRVLSVSGGVTFGGTAALVTHNVERIITPSGGIAFGGTAPMTFTSANGLTARAKVFSMGTRTMRGDSRIGMRFQALRIAA